MKRREFVEKLGIGSAGLVSGAVLAGGSRTPARADDDKHDHGERVTGALAHATVSFGQWKTEPPLDRYVTPNATPPQNNHQQHPYRARIKAGGSVSFIIAGFHQVAVYGPGTKPKDIVTTLTRPSIGGPVLLLINDTNNRIYAGLDPGRQPRDRVEVVHFPDPGLYLVICAVLVHFQDNMWGYVRVQGHDDDDE